MKGFKKIDEVETERKKKGTDLGGKLNESIQEEALCLGG